MTPAASRCLEPVGPRALRKRPPARRRQVDHLAGGVDADVMTIGWLQSSGGASATLGVPPPPTDMALLLVIRTNNPCSVAASVLRSSTLS